MLKEKMSIKNYFNLLFILCVLFFSLFSHLSVYSQDEILRMQFEKPFSIDNIGFLAAEQLGYYGAEKMRVVFKPGTAVTDGIKILEKGDADIIVAPLAKALESLKQFDLVHIAQLEKQVAYTLLCGGDIENNLPMLRKKDLYLTHISDALPLNIWLNFIGVYSPNKEEKKYNKVPLSDIKINPFSCAFLPTAHTYLISSFDTKIFSYTPSFDKGGILGRGIYVLRSFFKDEKKYDVIKNFLKASKKGWAYIFSHKQEAYSMLLNYNRQIDTPRAEIFKALYQLEKILYGQEGDHQKWGQMPQKEYEYSLRTILTLPHLFSIRQRPPAHFLLSLVNDI